MRRLLLDGYRLAILIKFHDTETLRIVHIVAKHRCSLSVFRMIYGCFQTLFQPVSGENIVTEHHRHGIIADEIRPDKERLRESVRRRLHCIGQVHTKLAAVSQKILKPRCILRR